MKFKSCGLFTETFSCADYLIRKINSFEVHDFSMYFRQSIHMSNFGYNYINLEEPIYALNGTIMSLNQLPLSNESNGNLAIDMSNLPSGKTDLVVSPASNQSFSIRRLHENTLWRFYFKAVARAVPLSKIRAIFVVGQSNQTKTSLIIFAC